VSTYRYLATNLLTGVVVADSLPLRVDSFGRNLAGVGQAGQLTGTLDLGATGFQSAYLGALEPRRTLLWVLQDEYPVWAGVVWDWQHQSAKADQLPIVANELGSLFSRRQIRVDQAFTNADLYAVIRGLVDYGLTKASGGVAQLLHTTNVSGTAVTTTFPAASSASVTDSINQFASQYGVEYAWDPGFSPTGALAIRLRIGTAATMGRPYSATNLLLEYPGNVADYSWPRLGSSSVNSLQASAAGQGATAYVSGPTHGVDTADLAAGFPLLEGSISYTGSAVTAQAQIDAYADARQGLYAKSPTIPTITIAGGQSPTAQQILLGDHATLAAISSLHPAIPGPPPQPGLVQDVRIIGWVVYPPTDQQAETTNLVLGGVAS
jgi:hypothetical protein